VAQRNGVRSSAASAYLSQVEKDNRLEVVTGAHVKKLAIDAGKKEARGVHYAKDGMEVFTSIKEGGE